ncbi:beta-glucosidase [Ranunculus cassubicifolius]
MVRVLRVTSISLVVFIFLLPYTSSGDVIHDGSSITTNTNSRLSRLDFPPGFIFGAGSSAYQVEGAAAEDGRKPSIWDTFTHQGKTADKGTGDIAADQYHKYKDDVKLMHDMGLDAYRFSISWSRIIPDGHGSVNLKGVSYYNNLINELVSYGIEAHVTLSHFDIPQTLQDEYEGQLGRKFIGDFTVYADVCFQEFGDRVKSWMTFNEPNIQTFTGNDIGMMPPGRCSYPFGVNCSVGDSTTEPYLAAHNILLAHAEAVHLYRTKYQEKQKGQIGITLLGFWIEPLTNSSQNIAASQRIRDFHLGWFLDPLVYGKYPAIMRKIVGSRLPFFTKNESKRLKGSFDFIGLNHYCALYVQDLPRTSDEYGSDYTRDISIKISLANRSPVTDLTNLKDPQLIASPWGLQRLLEYLKTNYKNPVTIIHENGLPTTEDGSTNPASRNDTIRIEYIKTYIASLLPSIRNGTNVRGYFVWSFIDVFEAAGGYHSHFGLYEVDFGDAELRRYPRQSVYWYSDFLAKTGRNIGTSSYL